MWFFQVFLARILGAVQPSAAGGWSGSGTPVSRLDGGVAPKNHLK